MNIKATKAIKTQRNIHTAKIKKWCADYSVIIFGWFWLAFMVLLVICDKAGL